MDQPQLSFKDADAASSPQELVINVDGGARGNPGPAGYGALVCDAAGNTVAELSEFIGIATNNVAEYRGLLAALEFARSRSASAVKVYSDSELIVRQVKGVYQVKSPDLKPLFEQVRRLASGFSKFSIHHVPRERNGEADRLANLAMDKGQRGGSGNLRAPSPAQPRSADSEQVFAAVVKNGVLTPEGPDAPVLMEGQRYEVRIRKSRGR